MIGTTTALALLLFGGWKWWGSEDARFNRIVFKPLDSKAAVITEGTTSKLVFSIEDSAWRHRNDSAWLAHHGGNSWTPFIEDHGKLMHLFLIRDDMNAFAHFHPLTTDSVVFPTALPELPAGHYRVFADIVHESGYAQTMVTSVNLDRDVSAGSPSLDPDDSWLVGPASKGNTTTLADGSTMRWARDGTQIVAGREAGLRFDIRNADGSTSVLEPYMGMAGHAVVARDDGSVFVHLHPSGTISMASQMAFEMRQPGDTIRGRLAKRLSSAEHSVIASAGAVGNVVAFPYAFPKEGSYRVWVQMKKNGRILTGAFDVAVSAGVKSAD